MRRCSSLLFWLTGFFLTTSALAGGHTYAVVVGIADYQALTYQTGDLRYADLDARRVAAFLSSRTGGSVPPAHLRLLINRAATGAAIRQALRLFAQAEAADRVILYFSGHGLPSSLVPYDVRPDQPRSLLTYADVKAAFRASRAGVKLCIADACLSGNLTRREVRNGSTIGPAAARLAVDTDRPGAQVALLLASRSTQAAIEDRRFQSGTFTHFLLEGLRGAADRNTDRRITIRELHDYVVPQVRRASNQKQSPLFFGRFSDALPLAYF